jgi:DNA-binding response OmpR family regulator
MKPKILIIDNDCIESTHLKRFLIENNYDVTSENHGLKALNKIKTECYDLCILETNLTFKTGFFIVKEIRKTDTKIPIFFLSQDNSKTNVLKGFQAGADDFIKKPFDKDIFNIKIKNILRNTCNYFDENFEFNLSKYHLNSNVRQLTFNNEIVIKLTPKECQLLKLLILNLNEFLSKSTALKLIWKKEDYFTGKCMDVYIIKLRKHLSLDTSISIENIRESGFRLLVR